MHMQAVSYDRYGTADELRLVERAVPTPADHEVLVKIQAVSINGSDRENLAGRPIYTRLFGLRRPRQRILGSDIAGRVVAAGAAVTSFQPGDDVYGELDGYHGGFAEYACAAAEHLTPLPADLPFDVAAALPQAGVIALAGIRGFGGVRSGQRVLINGAGGAAGAFAVQLAALEGAEVTAVDHPGKLPALRRLGAAHAVDHTRRDFSVGGPTYDRILDLIAHRSARAYLRALAPGGCCLVVGGSVASMGQVAVVGPISRLAANKHLQVLVVNQHDIAGLRDISELCRAGSIQPMVRRYSGLRSVPEAMRDVAAGRVVGKAVIIVPA